MTKRVVISWLLGSLCLTVVASTVLVSATCFEQARSEFVLSDSRQALRKAVVTFGQSWMPHLFWIRDAELFVLAENADSFEIRRYILRDLTSQDSSLKNTCLHAVLDSSQMLQAKDISTVQKQLTYIRLMFGVGRWLLISSLVLGSVVVIQLVTRNSVLTLLLLQAALVATAFSSLAGSKLIAMFVMSI